MISFRELFSMTDDGESAPTKRRKRGWKSQSLGSTLYPQTPRIVKVYKPDSVVE